MALSTLASVHPNAIYKIELLSNIYVPLRLWCNASRIYTICYGWIAFRHALQAF